MAKLPRWRSGAFVTVFTAALARALVHQANSVLGNAAASEELGVIVTSTSATSQVAFRFETTGTRDGWSLVDPFGLPSAIPSAVAAQVASAVGARGSVVTVLDSGVGLAHGLLLAGLELQRGVLRRILVAACEENCEVQHVARTGLFPNGVNWGAPEGAIGFILSVEREAQAGWHFTRFAWGSGNFPNRAPDAWPPAPLCRAPDTPSYFAHSSLVAAQTVLALLDGERAAQNVLSEYPGMGWRLCGFEPG